MHNQPIRAGERATASEVARQARLLEKTPHLRQLYDSVTDIVLILNAQRQIVFANRRMTDLLGLEDYSPLLGMRPGEALGCRYACGTAGGCGTTAFCAACGAVNAVLSSQAGHEDARECNILRGEEREALELLIRATPLDLAGERFTIVAATDISHEKRRRALERTFFHDLMNTAMGLKLFTRSLAKVPAEHAVRQVDRIRSGVERLLAEIEEQRDLAMAENNELAARPGIIRSIHFVEGLTDHYGEYCRAAPLPAADGRGGRGLRLQERPHAALARAGQHDKERPGGARATASPSPSAAASRTAACGSGSTTTARCRARCSSRCSSAPSPPRAKAAAWAPTA